MNLQDTLFKKELSRPQYATWNTRVEIGKQAVELFRFPLTNPDLLGMADKYGLTIALMVTMLNNLKIVDSVYIKPYAIAVCTYPMFRIDERIDSIVKMAIIDSAISNALGARPKMEIENLPNRKARLFKFDFELSTSRYVMFSRPLAPHHLPELIKIGPKCRAIVELLMTVPGVIEISFSPYTMTVTIADLFGWEEVELQVIAAVAKQFGELQISRK